ncbi:hypothetical protein COT96_00980 [Candidatus Falkowbacteria bacterium CG10_big_fil_rev_8_21_14_0_10_38_22]|uniref:DUF3006 domain-containing protein n=1 Tax=Candidatus Falkowbacteria bacterium CG10_big_fil_rev_8_21_14_0_10_38_22 TaxID=1974564 RepID=A0A2M6WRU3_9BACT|nr:MAG: hypothetical protein COT96_00980 [Candidatus Falkowbacteria bacterium CG10_big_fil_rev_8_21_14_0_10_38_22]
MLIKMTIDRFEADKAILKSTDGAMAIWPKNKLPAEAGEGAAITFDLAEEKLAELKNKKLAKDILNELLGTNS